MDPAVDADLQNSVDDITVNGDNVNGMAGLKTEAEQDTLFVEKAGFNDPPLFAKYGPNNIADGNNGIDGLYIKGNINNLQKKLIAKPNNGTELAG